MCGRYNLRAKLSEVADAFGVAIADEYRPLFEHAEIRPTQQVAVVRQAKSGSRELIAMRWGLVPSWSSEPKTKIPHFNARGETAASLPTFRAPFKRRRCLVPADSWLEWKKVGGTPQKPIKQKIEIARTDGRPFAFAGLWDRWEKEGQVVESCTIITTSPGPHLALIHDRMPVLVAPENYDPWLDPEFQAVDHLTSLLTAWPDEELVAAPAA